MADRIGIRKAGNAGLVPTTAGGPDLLHTIALMTVQTVTFPSRTFIIRKIMWSNNTGANTTLAIGTRNATPANVQMLPTILALNGFDGELGEADLPAVEFTSGTPTAAAAARWDGNAYVVCPAAGVLILVEVEEYGA